MKGFRTILINTGIAAGTAGLSYLMDYDWTKTTGPIGAIVADNVINIILRTITTTKVGESG